MEKKTEEATVILVAMANPKRLLVPCHLVEAERSVGQLAEIVGLSQAVPLQHLAKMRALRLVIARRDGQTIYYRLASCDVREVLQTLYRPYCTSES